MSKPCITYEMGVRKLPKDPELTAQAQKGYLSYEYWDRLQKAFNQYETWLATVKDLERAITPGKAQKHKKTKSLGYVNLTAIYLAIDEIESYLASYSGDLETWVNKKYPAVDAVRFTLACERAFENHPIKEEEQKLRRVRCPKCRTLTLVWKPAEHYADLILVKCNNPACEVSFEAETETGKEIFKVLVTMEDN